jgi:hypothetical protein
VAQAVLAQFQLRATCRPLDRGAITVDEGHELLGRLGEQLKLAGVERLAQPLQQEGVGAMGKARP